MDCPNCSTSHPDAARFCARCGTSLHSTVDRSRHFAAHPDEPVHALAVMSTLMPHLSGGRHHIYRSTIALALLAALIAAAFGILSVSLVLAAIALPVAVLTYAHDHNVWRDEPITVIGVAFMLSLMLGVALGLLENQFIKPVLLAAPKQRPPTLSQILELGVLIPIAGFGAVLIAPMLITMRSAFRHPIDAVVACSLSGAALSLGLSVVVQRGAFTHIAATAGDPAHVAFIALTLGFLQPIIFATAAAMAMVPLRGTGVNTPLGLTKGMGLVVLYELATTLLTPFGTRGIVLTTLAALVLTAAGLLTTRNTLHTALLAEAQTILSGDRALIHAPDTHQSCAHCGATIGAGAAFCQICGTATAALAIQPSPKTTADHRLRPIAIAIIVGVAILIAAAVTAAIVLTGTAKRPKLGPMLPDRHAATAAPAGSGISRPADPPNQRTPISTAGEISVRLTSADPIDIGQGISITPAPGWSLGDRGPNWVVLVEDDGLAEMTVRIGPANGTDVVAVLQAETNQWINTPSTGMSNVLLGKAITETLQSTNFQRTAFIDYLAYVSTQQGTNTVIGAFSELLNTSSQLSAFIDFRQDTDASDHAANAGKIMIQSML